MLVKTSVNLQLRKKKKKKGGMRWYNPTQAFAGCYVVFIICTPLDYSLIHVYFKCYDSVINHSHLSFASIDVVPAGISLGYQHQFVPEGTYFLGVCWCGGVQVRDAWPGGYSAICDDLWPDEILQAGVTHKGRSTHTMTGMIGRWCFLSSQPKPPVTRSYY